MPVIAKRDVVVPRYCTLHIMRPFGSRIRLRIDIGGRWQHG